MNYRTLGNSNIQAGTIGVGTEHLEKADRSTITSIVELAVENSINYFDLFLANPEFRDNFGYAFKGKRDKVLIAGHLGALHIDGQYVRSRDVKKSEDFFYDMLKRFGTDYVDVLLIHFVDEEDDFEKTFGPNGLYELALRLQKEGRTRLVGMSSHKVPVSKKAVENELIDVLMFPINPAFDLTAGDEELDSLWKDDPYAKDGKLTSESSRSLLHKLCARKQVSLVAMKVYAAGWLFWKENPSSIVLNSTQCLHYALSRPGVTTTVPGCKSTDELKAAIEYLTATDIEKDFSKINTNPAWNIKGSCMYCNHCLPCPVNINIARVIRILDLAQEGISPYTLKEYRNLDVKPDRCTECRVCEKRCPFDVHIVEGMNKALKLFKE